METLKYLFKATNENLEVPVTKTFPKGKQVWNIGEYNPYINEGYVILCNVGKECKVIPSSLEFLYVNSAENAHILHDAASAITVSINNLKNMEKYDKWNKKIVHKAVDIVKAMYET